MFCFSCIPPVELTPLRVSFWKGLTPDDMRLVFPWSNPTGFLQCAYTNALELLIKIS